MSPPATGSKRGITEKNPSAKIDVLELDLNSMASVKSFASSFLSMDLPLNVLINNAGVMATPFSLSADGIEMQFATNHIGHFLLTHLLLDEIKSPRKKFQHRRANRHRRNERTHLRFDKINDKASVASQMGDRKVLLRLQRKQIHLQCN